MSPQPTPAVLGHISGPTGVILIRAVLIIPQPALMQALNMWACRKCVSGYLE